MNKRFFEELREWWSFFEANVVVTSRAGFFESRDAEVPFLELPLSKKTAAWSIFESGFARRVNKIPRIHPSDCQGNLRLFLGGFSLRAGNGRFRKTKEGC